MARLTYGFRPVLSGRWTYGGRDGGATVPRSGDASWSLTSRSADASYSQVTRDADEDWNEVERS